MNNVYSVTQVNLYIKNMFTRDYALNNIYMKGEVSNCKYHTSGHIYFTLKDEKGQMACVMFAGQRSGLSFLMKEGQSVIALGSVNVYERDGKYQLYAKEIILDGSGILYQKYEVLKKSLEIEGLFSKDSKKPIPKYGKRVGIVTAKTGAALQDIINISNRRNPYVQLVLYPAKVQGEGAAQTIVKGIKELDKLGLDTIIIGRGGGSIEDLWAFNEEIVARAIFDCMTPIISAVGHETDVTIADFVSDLRAPTPSAAAELAVFDISFYEKTLKDYSTTLLGQMKNRVRNERNQVEQLNMRLNFVSPVNMVRQKRLELIDQENRLSNLFQKTYSKKKHKLELYIEKLDGLSPLKKLSQGYSFVVNSQNEMINSIHKISPKDNIILSVTDGEIHAKVTKVISKERK